MDILVWIFHVSTSNLSCHLCTSGGDLYIPRFHMEIFVPIKKFQQDDGYPSMDFPRFHILFIISPLY